MSDTLVFDTGNAGVYDVTSVSYTTGSRSPGTEGMSYYRGYDVSRLNLGQYEFVYGVSVDKDDAGYWSLDNMRTSSGRVTGKVFSNYSFNMKYIMWYYNWVRDNHDGSSGSNNYKYCRYKIYAAGAQWNDEPQP